MPKKCDVETQFIKLQGKVCFTAVIHGTLWLKRIHKKREEVELQAKHARLYS